MSKETTYTNNPGDKTVLDRARECISIMRKITDTLELPIDSSAVSELKDRMNDYIKTGEHWEGTVDFSRYDRIAHCVFPKKANRIVEVTLKIISTQKA
jgi:hypothetical protein